MSRLKEAITAIKSGDKNTGEKLLKELVRQNPQHETAWLWLAAVNTDVTQKRKHLQHVLEINPDNTVAREGLDRLEVPEIEDETPTLDDIAPPKSYAQKSAPKLKPLSSKRSPEATIFNSPPSVPARHPAPPTLTGSEIFSFITVAFLIFVAIITLLIGRQLQGVGIFILSLTLTLGVFEKQGRRMGRDVLLLRVMRIFFGLVAIAIFLATFVLDLR